MAKVMRGARRDREQAEREQEQRDPQGRQVIILEDRHGGQVVRSGWPCRRFRARPRGCYSSPPIISRRVLLQEARLHRSRFRVWRRHCKSRSDASQAPNPSLFRGGDSMGPQVCKFPRQRTQDASTKLGRAGEQGLEPAQVRSDVATELDALEQELRLPRQAVETALVGAPGPGVTRARTVPSVGSPARIRIAPNRRRRARIASR
jgi:hypothetical protein